MSHTITATVDIEIAPRCEADATDIEIGIAEAFEQEFGRETPGVRVEEISSILLRWEATFEANMPVRSIEARLDDIVIKGRYWEGEITASVID